MLKRVVMLRQKLSKEIFLRLAGHTGEKICARYALIVYRLCAINSATLEDI